MHSRVPVFPRACVRARARERIRVANRSDERAAKADGKGQQVTLYFRARDAAVIKKEIHQLAGGKYQVQQQRRRRTRRRGGEGGGGGRCAPPPLKYLCRMTSHFWNPAVYYKVLCTGTMTRAQTVTEATVITRKMVAAPVRHGI